MKQLFAAIQVQLMIGLVAIIGVSTIVMGGCCHSPVPQDPARTQNINVRCPEIRSGSFRLLSMKELEKSVWTNLFAASGRFETGWGKFDYQKVQDKVCDVIERSGRFGSLGVVGKGMDALSFDVRITKNEWFSDLAARPAEGLIVEVKVVAFGPVNHFGDDGAFRCEGRGESKIYISWGTASCSPITIDRYCSAVADAVEQAVADLHNVNTSYKRERKTDCIQE